MDTLKRYEVLHTDGNAVIFRDSGKSGYEPPVCYDRKTGKWSDITTEPIDLGWEGLGIKLIED